MVSLIELLENQELVNKLVKAGYEKLTNVLMNNEKIYTKKGRLNKSAACRVLGWKPKQLDDNLEGCRKVLFKEFDI